MSVPESVTILIKDVNNYFLISLTCVSWSHIHIASVKNRYIMIILKKKKQFSMVSYSLPKTKKPPPLWAVEWVRYSQVVSVGDGALMRERRIFGSICQYFTNILLVVLHPVSCSSLPPKFTPTERKVHRYTLSGTLLGRLRK